ncbi:MAG: hypothetical protein AAF423_08165 [Pseudomonadota bacterium]
MNEIQKISCIVVGSAGVGESGASSILQHRIDPGPRRNMIARTADSSLCGNTGVVALLTVNGEPVAHGNLTQVGTSIQAEVRGGDNVALVAHTVPLFNGIVCIRLGEIEISLEEYEFAGE